MQYTLSNFVTSSLCSLMQRDEGLQLVTEAICSGIFNDLGSGSNVDICVITKVCRFSLVGTFSWKIKEVMI